jgi:N-methylhydantoinase B
LIVREAGSSQSPLDPITLEVIRGRFDTIAEEMELTLLRASRSTLIKEALDASAALFDAGGRTIAQANSIPSHLGMLVPAVRRLLEEFPLGEMNEADLFIMNDPYDGGTHLPDITVLGPVFHNGQVVALACTMAHHQDVGGKTPGSTPPDAVDLYAEGLVLPPLRLHDAGRPNETLLSILRSNTRLPQMLIGDLEAQVAAVRTGERRLKELFASYGTSLAYSAIEQLMDHGERLTRQVIAGVPDGKYQFVDYLDDDGVVLGEPVAIHVTITIDGDHMTVDFTGTSAQVRGSLNCVPASTNAMVYLAVRLLAGPGVPNNDGYQRCVTIIAPEGTLVNPRPPAPVSIRSVAAKRLCETILGALVRACPDRMPAAADGQSNLIFAGGTREVGGSYVTILGVPTAGGWGGRPGKDGIDVLESESNNLLSVPTEAFELEYPEFRIEQVRLWPDSGGPGRWRGGLGHHCRVRLLKGRATVTHRRDRHTIAPWGLFGGHAAPLCRTTLERSGEKIDIPAKSIFDMRAGDCLDIFTTGGGGYGDPLERDPSLVAADVRQGRVTGKQARNKYGVVVRNGRFVGDETEAARVQLRQQRGPVTWTYDRGPSFTQSVGGKQFEP